MTIPLLYFFAIGIVGLVIAEHAHWSTAVCGVMAVGFGFIIIELDLIRKGK